MWKCWAMRSRLIHILCGHSRSELDKLTIPFADYQIVELVDRAHVTRLTAERDGLAADADALKAQVKRLKDECIALGYVSDERDSLQSELTKARELLNQWLNMFEGGLKSGDLESLWNNTADYVDPTANQSAPAAKGESDE